ncbi:MAG: hypothetical protein PHN69_01785 [Candidatus Pacebacteria bacterium]|nr:hypothetical protein [Candidatus Paceibacterota bacterium]
MNNKKITILLSLILSLVAFSSVYSQGVQKKNDISPEPKMYKVQNDIGTTSSSTLMERERERERIHATSSTSTQNRTKNDSKNNKGGLSEEHRSEVSNFVQTLLDTADRNGGIGQQVRNIAREQASTSSTTTEAIEKVEKRSGLKTFLIGSDYKNLGKVRSEIVGTKNRIEQLNRELDKMATSTDKIAITEEIKSMEELQNKLEKFVEDNEGKFSLFGWFVKMFE